ncbi:MAG: hypothetical protein A2073_03395 [Deltaproteobacteria bacterium GWC2_42_11]|nr:MAG: hypothetical protein A2073_03395 [Deltaproteobacteria bacterium GWC2_42_11]HBO84586.1 hypothetical protein [Deltaproteobacteria bacterium]
MEKRKEITPDPRYAPPYPQKFHSFWPTHVVKASIVVAVVISLITLLAYFYRLPTDLANNITLPDQGMYIPGPEWYYLFLLQPFWYFTGDLAKWQFIGTAIIPLIVIVFVILIPFVFKKKKQANSVIQKLVRLLLPLSAFSIIILGITFSGYHAKLHGCIACHNPQTGVRQNLPPMNVAEFYKVERQRQIQVGKYRASKTDAEGASVIGKSVETYKDANWQMRHIYEPTFTW